MRERRLRRRDPVTAPAAAANLPVFLTFFLCLVTLYTLIFELLPARADHGRASAALERQTEIYDRLCAERDAKEREHYTLANDPQAVERALDERGLIPEPPKSEK